jgi:hypothetical protein
VRDLFRRKRLDTLSMATMQSKFFLSLCIKGGKVSLTVTSPFLANTSLVRIFSNSGKGESRRRDSIGESVEAKDQMDSGMPFRCHIHLKDQMDSGMPFKYHITLKRPDGQWYVI